MKYNRRSIFFFVFIIFIFLNMSSALGYQVLGISKLLQRIISFYLNEVRPILLNGAEGCDYVFVTGHGTGHEHTENLFNE